MLQLQQFKVFNFFLVCQFNKKLIYWVNLGQALFVAGGRLSELHTIQVQSFVPCYIIHFVEWIM